MASGPITPWQIEGEKVEAVTDFLFLGSKFTADGDSSHEIRRWLPLGRKAMTSLDKWVKKQRHHFANKGLYSQSYGFSSSHIWMWELDHKEGWVPKNWYLLTVVLEKTPESPSDCKEIKPVNLKGNQPWIFIGSLMLTLQYFGHLTQRADSLEKTLMLGKIEGRRIGDDRGWDGWMPSLTQWTWVWVNCRSWWWTGRPSVLQSTGLQRVRHDWVTELNWTDPLKVKWKSLSHVWLFATPWTIQSMEFSRPEHWSR